LAESAESIRLQVALARAGIASRRHAAEIVRAGRVTVDDETIIDPAWPVIPSRSRICIDGATLPAAEPHRYFALHKPPGVLSSADDDRGRPTVTQFLPSNAGRCVPVGRLDLESEGLLLLTNDGPLIDALLHPRAELPRVYLVEVKGRPTDADLQQLYDGVPIDGGATASAKPKRSKRPGRPAEGQRPATSWMVLTLRQGRKREVRQMCQVIGHTVVRLIRVQFGPILLRELEAGHIRELTPHERTLLQRSAALTAEQSV
jgi:23S rRNA pseudouridine2605 synthase